MCQPVQVLGSEGRNAAMALPEGYEDLLAEVRATVAAARRRAQRVVNTELLLMYWDVGHAVLDRQGAEGWGARVIDRLAADVRAEFPEMRGLSRTNVWSMRAMAGAWGREAIVQQPVGRLPWGHVILLLTKLDQQHERDWYAAAAVEHGWSRQVLTHHVATGLRARTGSAPSNFTTALAEGDSDLAQALTRDPYVLDFLDATAPLAERELEDALLARLQDFMLELGHGFAFVGRQYRFAVDGEDYTIDLLFFHWQQCRFTHAHAGQLGFYVAWVEENLRLPERHAPTVGIVLCTTRSDNVVRYSLAGSPSPMAVATYTYDALPDAVRAALPTEVELATATAGILGDGTSLLDGEDP